MYILMSPAIIWKCEMTDATELDVLQQFRAKDKRAYISRV